MLTKDVPNGFTPVSLAAKNVTSVRDTGHTNADKVSVIPIHPFLFETYELK